MIRLSIALLFTTSLVAAQPSGKEILDRIDENMSSDTRYIKSKMVIHGPRTSRTIESESWSEGDERAYTGKCDGQDSCFWSSGYFGEAIYSDVVV